MSNIYQSDDVVVARCTKTSAQTISVGGNDIVDFDTKEIDTHSAVTTGVNWAFTAPVGGTYSVSSSIVFSNAATFSAGNVTALQLFTGASRLAFLHMSPTDATTAQYRGLTGSTLVKLTAGQSINIRVSHGEGTTRNLATFTYANHVSIVRVGN